MAITRVQVQGVTNGNPATYASANTAGNLLVAFLRMQFTETGITDSQGNTWARAGSDNGAGPVDSLWYAPNCKAGANTVTIAGGGQWFGAIAEYSGIALASPLDQTNQGTGTSTAVNSGSITTLQASELIVAVFNRDNATVTSPSMTQISLVSFAAAYEQIVSATGSYAFTATISPSATWFANIASFKAAASVGGVPNSLAMLGCGT